MPRRQLAGVLTVGLVLTWFLTGPGLAQIRSREFMLVVLVPTGMAPHAPQVEAWVGELKSQRRKRRKGTGHLPILRMTTSIPEHRHALVELGLRPKAEITTHLCHRSEQGWPTELVHSFGPKAPAETIVRTALAGHVLTPVERAEVGLLLLYGRSDSPDKMKVDKFLAELGRYWLERYGRVKPSPYPLAYYDTGNSESAAKVRLRFPELFEKGTPVVAVCTFREGRPQEVLQQFRSLDTPASLVRLLSAARTRLMASPATTSAGVAEAPAPSVLGLPEELETTLLVSRLNETAQQLFDGTKHEAEEANKNSLKILLQIIEVSREAKAGDATSLAALKEAVRDYQVEPIILSGSSRLREVQSRFQELSRTLLTPR